MLAAGGSTRMGRPKQLIPHRGKPLVSLAAESAVEAGADPVIVVLGARAEEIGAAVSRVAGITAVINADWETGLASSLAAGLRVAAQDTGCEAVMVTLADQPLVDGAMLRRLIAAFGAGSRIIASGYDGVPGVPALFGREHVPDLLSLTGDAGAGPWLRSRQRQVTIVPLDSVLLDLDTPGDVARLAGRPRSS